MSATFFALNDTICLCRLQCFLLKSTGVFKESRYFDVYAEYCKGSPNDILGRYTVINRGPDEATIHVLPQLWFRNVWDWGDTCDVSQVSLHKKVFWGRFMALHTLRLVFVLFGLRDMFCIKRRKPIFINSPFKNLTS